MIYPPPALTALWELLLERASADGALLSFWSLGEGEISRLRAGGQRNQRGMGNDGMAQYGSVWLMCRPTDDICMYTKMQRASMRKVL